MWTFFSPFRTCFCPPSPVLFHLFFPLLSTSASSVLKSSMITCLWAQYYAGVVQVTRAAVRSWMRQPLCMEDRPPHPLALTFFSQESYHEGMLNFVKGLCCISGDDHMVSLPDSFYVIYYICWFPFVGPFLYPWNETNLMKVCVLICCCMWLVGILWKLVFMFIRKTNEAMFLLLCCVLIQFWCQSNTGFIEQVWWYSFPFYFMKQFRLHIG